MQACMHTLHFKHTRETYSHYITSVNQSYQSYQSINQSSNQSIIQSINQSNNQQRRSRPYSVSKDNNSLWGKHANVCIYVGLFVEPTVSWSKEYVRSWIICMDSAECNTPVSPDVHEMVAVHTYRAIGNSLFWECVLGGVEVLLAYQVDLS